MFQSTHPHGVRPLSKHHSLSYMCFNPRTHTGCDSLYALKTTFKPCFNPRTHTGCDNKRPTTYAPSKSFNPRTHTGCDCSQITWYSTTSGFNPRTHTGCDAPRRLHGLSLSWFQSTHPHGVRLCRPMGTLHAEHVSIHAPTRGATAWAAFS